MNSDQTQPAPHRFTRTFRIRYYECDAYGHLNHANYVRFMQETAFDASAAVGLGFKRYQEMGRLWLVRNTHVEYLTPLKFGESVCVTTYVADIRRASSRRKYEFRLAGQEEIVASGFSDWVFIDQASGRPTTVSEEVAGAYFPDGLPESFPARPEAIEAPPPPPGVFKTRQRVAWRDLDTAGIVNNPVYLIYLEDCGFQAIAAHKWPWKRMAAENLAILLRSYEIQYLQPARADDELEISTWVSGVRRSTAWRHYTIHRLSDGAEIVRASTLGVWVNLDTGRPARIPEEMLADFSPNIVHGAG